MKILFTGAQGTGKTTVMNEVDGLLPGYQFISSISRRLQDQYHMSTEGGKLTTCSMQRMIFDTYLCTFSNNENVISDRSLIDVLAYTWDKAEKDDDVQMAWECQSENKHVRMFTEKFKDDSIYFYFPIEFDIVRDGVRSIDKEYQRAIDDKITRLLDTFNIEYRIVRGTVEERVNFVMSIVRNCI